MDGENGVARLVAEPVVVGTFDADHPWPGLPAETEDYLISMSIAYNPKTGQVDLDGSFRGGPEGRLLLELAAEQVEAAFPKK